METSFLARSKGLRHLVRRMWAISRSYGLKPNRMEQALERFVTVLETHGGRATLPVPAVTLARQLALVRRLEARGIELAVHGWTHIPLDTRSADEQHAHLHRAREAFIAAGIQATGFRAPYLGRDENLRVAAEDVGFTYVSNQPILWDVLETETFEPAAYATYERAIAFYSPWRAKERLSLPQLYNHMVEIPVSLPDDEMLGDRLGATADVIERVWRRILADTHRRGELFTIQLHPERIARCADGLSAVLAEARTLSPAVWLARLDEIAAWWQARTAATVEISDVGDGRFRLSVAGPSGSTLLARGVAVDAPTKVWSDDYRQVEAMSFTLHAPTRPFIGLSPATSPKLADFLRQQGYIAETTRQSHGYSYYFDQAEFSFQHERPLLAQIEGMDRPLVRLCRWPAGARSALAITGDIDALTLWDYGLRLIGK
jgi:peptidoglycan/xylan/chitin deacetylase (PgdA/CDA1 family)